MLSVAIVGSGPAGFYTAEALLKARAGDVAVDVIDRLPTPFGLVRSGVAPDHQSLKAVARRFDATSRTTGVRFVGNVEVGEALSITELRQLYHAVVLATGAPHDRRLGIPGEDLPGVIGSAAFVGWYNGHPDFAQVQPPLAGPALVVGNGNVAIDVARILLKTPAELAASDIADHAAQALACSRVERVSIIGRRGPHQVSFSPKELGEMGELERARPRVDLNDFPPLAEDAGLEPGLRKVVGLLRGFGEGRLHDARERELRFLFWSRPKAVEGAGRIERLVVERTRLEGGRLVETGDEQALVCRLLVTCIGYRTSPVAGVPYDDTAGRFLADEEGRIAPGLYAVGWARRGPTGTIGTNRRDGFGVADRILAEAAAEERPGGAGLDALLLERDRCPVTYEAWERIDAAETARARQGAPREKLVEWKALLAAARG